ncbi:MAG: addiction module toxin RelE [Gammaproteobacteria bacterium]|nr:addiction module toxin RelE [Gammaproteobacteria bacterium]
MARPLRIEYAGALYHVTSRGDRRDDIYRDDEDRQIWLELFAQVCSRFNWRCHTWCQMDNHYHILVETAEGNLSLGMRQLNGVYTQKSNRRHGLIGHVFQGRYKAILVQKDAYLLELSRYVVLNPVRARMVNDVHEWQWSSYNVMADEQTPPEWLETDWLLACFGKRRSRCIAKYKDFVRAGVGLPPVWENMKHQMYLGDDGFIERIRKKHDISNKEALKEVTRLQRRSLAKPLQWYRENIANPKEAMAEAFATGGYSMKEIGDCFEVHYSTVSRAVKALEENGG